MAANVGLNFTLYPVLGYRGVALGTSLAATVNFAVLAGAWRAGQDLNLPGVDELKLRAAYGTAGGRPRFDAQYETYSVSAGQVSPVTLGNKNLKPEATTDNAVGEAEEENLQHLTTNLAGEGDPAKLVPILTSKHPLEYCLMYAARAASHGFKALTVLGGDRSVGPARCVEFAYRLRRLIRERVPDLALGGWANPHRDAAEQERFLLNPESTAEFYLTQVVSHHGMRAVEAFVTEARRREVPLPGVFGVFAYRSANPETLAKLRRFFPVPAAELTKEFSAGATPEEICARTIRALRDVAGEKPVAVVMGEMATSAGYMTALGGDRIFAREGSITGSIGVILQATDITGLLGKLGITTEALKSGPLKAVPSPLEPLTPAGRAATMEVIHDIFDMFVDLVAKRRSMTKDRVLGLADGRVFTGRQALASGLVGEIGGEKEPISGLGTSRGIDTHLPVRELEGAETLGLWGRLASMVTGKALFSERLTLDGLVSLWHPELR